MISNYLEILILGIIQGISEFIPVSSSAHLFIYSKLHSFNSSSLEIDVSLHLGSLIAIILYFKNDLINFYKKKEIAILIVLGSLPLVIFGLFLYQTGLINSFRNIKIIAWTTLVFGILLYFADKFKVNKKLESNLTIKNILIIGCFQILALIPGVSRSGITITAGRLLNFNRVDSSKISFYLSIPALCGASFLGLSDIANKDFEISLILFFATLCSFIFSYLTIKYFLIYVNKFSLNIFIYYRIFLSLILFAIIYS